MLLDDDCAEAEATAALVSLANLATSRGLEVEAATAGDSVRESIVARRFVRLFDRAGLELAT